MKIATTANPRERREELGQFLTASSVAVERLARSLGIPNLALRGIEADFSSDLADTFRRAERASLNK